MSATPIQDAIHDELVRSFAPSVLEVINESGNHNVPRGSETHFKVVIVSEGFAGETLVSRHRAVNKALAQQLAAGVHALSIQALTPAQWDARGGEVPASPPCLGGSKA
ncbi:transcriptional regulator BolA [Enhygromyxa salina]|uniref:DNA-binding transcriptional regulator BolA n=1 Tax=Enhygromyxa salina TaxID=215803 RepID=A0A2S9XGK3_9BACT|nr:BolA/IbaG family iron-sulfur metabolism protein [Enhygromyxa salina]PRP91998.1 transcriptional regulator BolA [Enhygromyxa salina]